MRRLALALPLLALLAIPLASASASPEATAISRHGPLQTASQQLSGWRYSLESLAGCEVNDAIALVKNVSSHPITITHVSMLTGGGGFALAADRWSYELVRFRVGSTTGEISGSNDLAALRNGRPLGRAVGGVIGPVRSGSWYDVVARIRVPAGRTSAWEIHGVAISYRVGSRQFSTSFRQSVHLPATTHCN